MPRTKITVGEKNDPVLKYKDRMKVYREFREQNFDKSWDENYNMYLSNWTADLHSSPTRSKLFVPMAFWTVENWLTKVAAAFFSGDRIWEVIPRFKKSSELVKATQYLLDYQTDIYGWDLLLMDILKSTGMYGISWTFFGWDLKVKEREVEIEEPVIEKGMPKRDDVTGEILTRTRIIKEPYVDQDKPLALLVPPKEVYFDPKGVDVDSCLSIVREYYQDFEAVEKKKKDGIYNKNFDLSELTDMSSKEFEKDTHKNKAGISEPRDSKRKRILTQDVYEDGVFYTILNEKLLAKEKTNPLPRKTKPIMLIKDIALPNELRALSEIDPIKNINIERNTIRNQRIDQVSLDINRMYLVDKNAIVDKKQFYSAPNHCIEVNPVAGGIQNAVVPLVSPSVPMSSYTEESMLDNDAQQASGQLDYAIGNTPARREAARTVRSLQTVAFQRFDLTKVKPLMFQLKRFPYLVLLHDKTYLTDDSIDVRVFNKLTREVQWESVKVEDIDTEVDFRYQGSLGKSMKIERREELRIMLEQAMAYQTQMMSMGAPPIWDMSVPMKYWLKEAEWSDIAEDMTIGKQTPEVPISPQTLQKDLAAQDKMRLEQMRMNPEGQQVENQGAEAEQNDEGEARKKEMAMKDEQHKQKMQQEWEKHQLKMQMEKEKNEASIKAKAAKKDE